MCHFIACGVVAKPAGSTPIRVAALFTQSTGKEYICISKAFEKIGSRYGFDLTVDVFEYDNSISDLIQKTKSIVAGKYDAVIGPRTSQESIATTPILGAAKIPQILPSASQKLLTTTAPMAVSMVADSDRYGALSAKHIMNRLKAKNILVVANISQPYSTNYADLLPKQLEKIGYKGEIDRVDFIEGSADFEKVARVAKVKKVDLIYAALYGMDVANLYAAVAKADMPVTIFARAGIFELRDLFGKQFSSKANLIFNGIWDNILRGPHKSEFTKMMKSECPGQEIGVRSVTGFESLAFLLDTLKASPELRGSDLARALRKGSYSGLLGPRKYDRQSGALLMKMPLFSLKKNGFYLLEIIE